MCMPICECNKGPFQQRDYTAVQSVGSQEGEEEVTVPQSQPCTSIAALYVAFQLPTSERAIVTLAAWKGAGQAVSAELVSIQAH